MGFNEFISKLFGNKATRDMKEIQPWVEKVGNSAVGRKGKSRLSGNFQVDER